MPDDRWVHVGGGYFANLTLFERVFGMPVVFDPDVPPGELRFEQEGRVVGRIMNIRVEDDREIRHPFE